MKSKKASKSTSKDLTRDEINAPEQVQVGRSKIFFLLRSKSQFFCIYSMATGT